MFGLRVRLVRTAPLALSVLMLSACGAGAPGAADASGDWASSTLPDPTEADVARAQIWAPEATVADLERGRTLYADRCSSCHQLMAPSAYPQERWPGFVSEMRQQAALKPDQERHLVLYLRVMASRTEAAGAPPSHL